jgi:hypothetical protein
MLALPLPSPGVALSPIGPALCDEHTADPGDQGSQYAHASDDERHPKGSGVHSFMMAVGTPDSYLALYRLAGL